MHRVQLSPSDFMLRAILFFCYRCALAKPALLPMLRCSMVGSLPGSQLHMRTVTTGPRPAPREPAGKETMILNLAFALIPGFGAARHDAPPEADEGFLGKL